MAARRVVGRPIDNTQHVFVCLDSKWRRSKPPAVPFILREHLYEIEQMDVE
jgi:hypothetical protein